jgi:NAD(P)-dependent dehydrogenase (short-subunit alcohol dehydrogenase family)
MTIADRAVLVTGANRGIGQALVEEALRRGAKRVYAGTRQPLAHLDERVTALTLDVTNAAQIQGAVERVESLDILINNAGVALFDDLSDCAALERHLAVNLFGTYGVTQAFLPLLTRSRGAIVNVLSVAALVRMDINMATYWTCHFKDSRLPFHPRRMNNSAEIKPIHNQFVPTRKATLGESDAKIYVAILCCTSYPNHPPGCGGLLQ